MTHHFHIAGAALAAALLTATAAPAVAGPTFQCSGIGDEDRAAAASVPQTLRLIYAQPNGQYLGEIATRISSGATDLVSVTCPGPWLLVDLPDGRYKVAATYQGKTVTREVSISGGKLRKEVIVF